MPVLYPPLPDLTVARPYAYAGSPFAAGRHRGVDLAAAPGTAVAAPCAGVVAWAGPAGVTLRCGAWRVTLLPVEPRVRAGDRPGRGAVLGSVGDGGHGVTGEGPRSGLHVGVRRADDPFGYVAPRFRRAPSAPVDVVGPGRRIPPGAAPPLAAPVPAPAPGRAEPLTPWPAWAGLAFVLAAVRVRARRLRRDVVRATRPVRAP